MARLRLAAQLPIDLCRILLVLFTLLLMLLLSDLIDHDFHSQARFLIGRSWIELALSLQGLAVIRTRILPSHQLHHRIQSGNYMWLLKLINHVFPFFLFCPISFKRLSNG